MSALVRATTSRGVAAATLAAAILATASAGAQSTTAAPLSAYERESLDVALARLEGGGVVDPSPAGKILERVDVVALDVIEDRDAAPSFLNALHATTRESVIRREVLLAIGERYRQYFVDETIRVLRLFRQLSLVLAVPLRGARPDTVRLLVVTKDVWSLRTQIDIGLGATGLEKLTFEPTERNVAGTLNSVFGRLDLRPETVTLGAGGYVPRIGGRRLYLTTDANAIVNRAHGHVEGVYGQARVTTPQVTARQQWLWAAGSSWRSEITRRYVGAEVASFDAPATPEVERITDAYRARHLTQGAQATRSFGLAHKLDVSFGAEINLRHYHAVERIADTDPAIHAEYRRLRLPTSDTRVAPWGQVRVYESRFHRTYDLDTLGFGEDYRLGYDAWARLYPVTRALGSSRDLLGADAFAQYAWTIGDGLARIRAETVVDLTTSGTAATFAYGANATFYGPRFLAGRLVTDVLVIGRPENYLNQRTSVGGESRLRGQPSYVLIGENVVAATTELRSRAVRILSVQVGGAAFLDVADAFDRWVATRLKSSVGGGLRVVIPQLDRNVIRLDVGVPIVRAEGAGPVGFYVAIEQAFFARSVEPPSGLVSPASSGALAP